MDATLLLMSCGDSSKAIRTPGSLNSVAPRTRNSRPIIVLPEPGPPQTMVVRPRGKPPPLIRSNPFMPVGHLGTIGRVADERAPFSDLWFWLARAIAIASPGDVKEVTKEVRC